MSLAPRLVAFSVLLTIVTGAAIAGTTINDAQTAVRDQILRTQLAVADLVAEETSDYMTNVKEDTNDLADNQVLQSRLEEGDFEKIHSLLASWTTASHGRVEAANLYSPAGLLVATSSTDRSRLGTAAQNDFAPVVSSGAPMLGVPLNARSTGKSVVPYIVPVFDENGSVAGVLSVGISLQALSDRLLALPLGDAARISVTENASGLLLVHTDRDRVMSTLTTGRNEASRRARAGERGAMENVTSNGERTLAAFSPVFTLNWGVVIQEPADVAFAPISAMTLNALEWVSAAAIVAIALATLLGVSLVRPLRRLRSTAERMSNGDFGRRTGVLGGGEIGDLGRAFDRMAEQLEKSIATLTHQAQYDAVTGLPNRVVLRERLDRGDDLETLALLIMDLDRFKEVNDTLGHPAGDALLREIGRRLTVAAHAHDVVARLGGDEFGIVLGNSSARDALTRAQEFARVVEAPFEIDGHTVTIGASIGISIRPLHGADADALLRCADVAMYVAKRSNEGVVQYQPELDHHTPDQLAFLGDLRDALANDELTLAFQPLVDCDRSSVAGVEALARWTHPRHGVVSPEKFIRVAEQSDLIKPLTRWVLKSALRQHREWRDAGFFVPVSVNLSMRDVQDGDLPRSIMEILQDFEIGSNALRVELTESTLMSDPTRALQTLTQLCAMGISISVDDFGTGYSSLAYLKKLPVDELKIDRSFVRDMANDDSDLAIVRSTMELAHNLGLRVVAEGVEDAETFALLRSMGCDKVQGYFFSRPLPALDATRWLSSQGSRPAVQSRAA